MPMFIHVLHGTSTSLVPVRRKMSCRRFHKSRILYTIINAYNSLRCQSIGFPFDGWPRSLFFFSFWNSPSSGLLSSSTAWFVHLIWHFITNCPLSWIFCSSVLPLSRRLHVHIKSMFRCIFPCSFLCSILHLNLQHPSCSAIPAGFSSSDSSSHLVFFCLHASSNWLKAICLQIWPLALVQSGVWLWQHNQTAKFTPSYINSLIVQLQETV